MVPVSVGFGHRRRLKEKVTLYDIDSPLVRITIVICFPFYMWGGYKSEKSSEIKEINTVLLFLART